MRVESEPVTHVSIARRRPGRSRSSILLIAAVLMSAVTVAVGVWLHFRDHRALARDGTFSIEVPGGWDESSNDDGSNVFAGPYRGHLVLAGPNGLTFSVSWNTGPLACCLDSTYAASKVVRMDGVEVGGQVMTLTVRDVLDYTGKRSRVEDIEIGFNHMVGGRSVGYVMGCDGPAGVDDSICPMIYDSLRWQAVGAESMRDMPAEAGDAE